MTPHVARTPRLSNDNVSGKWKTIHLPVEKLKFKPEFDESLNSRLTQVENAIYSASDQRCKTASNFSMKTHFSTVWSIPSVVESQPYDLVKAGHCPRRLWRDRIMIKAGAAFLLGEGHRLVQVTHPPANANGRPLNDTGLTKAELAALFAKDLKEMLSVARPA